MSDLAPAVGSESDLNVRVFVPDRPAHELARRDAILKAIAFAASTFLRAPDLDQAIPPVLQRLGESAAVGRTFLCESRRIGDRRLFSERYEWIGDGLRDRTGLPRIDHESLDQVGLSRWEALLAAGGTIHGPVADLPEPEREWLGSAGVRSIAVVPLFVQGEWWGYLGFEDYRADRAWSAGPLAALHAAADLFGGMLTRNELDERARALLGATAEGIAVHDGTRILDVNPSFTKIFGYSADEVIGSDPGVMLPLAQLGVVGEASTSDETGPHECAVLRKDGSSLPAELTSKTIHYQGREVRIVTIRDISARKAAEEAKHALLREHAARREAEAAERQSVFLAEASRILNSSLDYHTSLARFARLAVPFLGDYCIIDVVVGEEIRRVATAHADQEREHLAKALLAFPPTWSTNPIVKAYGTGRLVVAGAEELRPESISANPDHQEILGALGPTSGLFAPMHGPDGVLGVASFVSCDPDRRYAPEELAFAEDLANRAAMAVANAKLFHKAQEAIRERDEVLAVVAHDLRNPLNGVSGGATMLMRLLGNEAPGRKYAEIIQVSADRMNRLIQDLLDVTRIERGRLPVEVAPTAAAPLVGEAVLMLQQLAEAQDIRLVADPIDPQLRVLADSSRILQVFSNLVGNALKFTPAGGRVTVACRTEPDSVCFSVSDTGPGIPADQIPQLFGRFWQGRSGDYRGVGLGLSIVKGIVEAHQGRVWVESVEGQGSTFHFTLPLVQAVTPVPSGAV